MTKKDLENYLKELENKINNCSDNEVLGSLIMLRDILSETLRRL